MDLDSMKYAEMRQLAKSVGLKANMKADKMLVALKQHFAQQESLENGIEATSDDPQFPEQAGVEPEPANDTLVTTRRIKKQQGKRKYSGDGADLNPKPEESPVQDDSKLSGKEEEEGGGKRSSKRRKVSSAKDTEPPAPEVKPESAADDAVAEEGQKDTKVVKKPAGKIPRHKDLMKKKAALRPTTPNFKKLHEAHFSKMESIDSYVQRRNKQMEVLRNSVKDLKDQSENATKKAEDSKTHAKPSVSLASLFSPGVPEKKAEKRRVAQAPAGKPAMKDSAPFKPSILSTNRINVRFSQTTMDNEHKRSLVKTPARMSPILPLTSTQGDFSKMESINSCVQMEVPQNSVKDLKPSVSLASLFSPGVPEKKAKQRRVAQAPAGKPAMKDSAPFKPSILSSNGINVRFSQTTMDNEHKRSLVKTPARMSPILPLTPTPGRKSEVNTNKNMASVNKTPGVTPFIFRGTSGTPATNKKNMFDLKASLSRPLRYKPHKGKLKPFGAAQENAVLNKSQTLPSHQKNYKQHQVQTRDERREKHKDDRKQKKEKMLGARRGLAMV
ncbi:nucleolar and spindle-associated protein 1 isoform X2 [Hemibagrus wyckioides]|uniref:nucleolar and spindle-associated protein 1 isoform X2 n=1 Tax=Hemibagrus wyckioides TaxID=337641 RepID=UPI00266D123D|nr:nucleolar and spindle-associated protein 1 isoform X2 [Hemibagrus wyckioides]